MKFSINLIKECLGEIELTISPDIAEREREGKKLLFDRVRWLSQYISALQPRTLYLTDLSTLRGYLELRKRIFPEDICFFCVGIPQLDEPDAVSPDRQAIPWIAVNDGYDLALIGNKCQDYFQELREWEQKLDLLFYQAESFQDFFDASAPYFGNQILMWDKSFNVQASLISSPPPRILGEILEKGYFPKNVIENIMYKNLLDVTVGNDVTRTIPASDTISGRELLVRHFCQDGFRIYSIAYFNSDNFIRPGERERLEFFFDHLILHLTHMETKQNDELHRSADIFFRDILSGVVSDPGEIYEKAQAFHIPPNIHYACYVLRMDQYSKTKARYLINYLRGIMPTEHVFEYNEEVILIKNTLTYNCIELGRVGSFENFLKTSRAYCGISFVFTDLRQIPGAYKQAEAAIRLGLLMGEEEGPIFFYQKYYYYHILEIVNREIDLRMISSKKLNRILDDDQKHNTNNVHLLEVLIKNNLSATDTAAELFLHRNSIVYRIRKLEQQFHIDFSNHAEIQRLSFSLMCQRYLKALEGRP